MTAPRPLPAAHRLLPRVYYGWVVALACGAVSFVTIGIGFYGQSVLLEGFTSLRGFDRAEVSGPASLYFMTAGVAGIFVGRLVDRRGAREVMVAGTLLMAGVLVLVGQVERSRWLWLLYPVMALGFSMAGAVPMNAIVTRWFVALRARAMSFSHTGVSLGGILLVPLASGVLHRHGIAASTWLMGGVVVVVALPITLWVLRFDPREHGLAPDGGRTAPGSNPLLSEARQGRRWTGREALSTRTFWLLAASFAGILFCQQSVLVHEIALVGERSGLSSAGAFAVSITAAASATARLVVGGFADRVSKQWLAVGMIAFQALTLLGFAYAPGVLGLYVAAVGFGATIGNVYMLQSLLAGELFGYASFGVVFGMLQLVSQVVGGTGPWALGVLYERTGAYTDGLLAFAGIALASAALLACVRPPPEPAANAAAG